MGNEALIKFIINIFCQYYKYNIEEFKAKDSKLSFWGLSKISEGKKEYIILLDEENFYNINTTLLKSENNQDQIEIRKVVIINKDNRLGSNWHRLAEGYDNEIVVVDELTNRVIYFSPASELLARQIQSILEYKQEVKEKEFKKARNGIGIITTVLIITNVIMYIFTAFLSGNIFDANIYVLIGLGAKENTLIAQGEYYRFVTAMFLHGGIIHILSNMYALSTLGPTIEKAFGKIRYLLIYFLGGIISIAASYIFSEDVSIGASGAIFALLGAVLVLAIRARNRLGKEMIRSVLSVIAINLFIGFSLPNIDNFAHIGGLISGILISSVIKCNDGF